MSSRAFRPGILGAVAAATYLGFLVARASHAVGGSDSSGYLNAATAIASGTVPEPVEKFAGTGLPQRFEPAFIPLGYVPGPRPGTMSPLYPPGLPLHMAAALAISRDGPFLVAPLAAAASVVLLFFLARDLGLGFGPSFAASAILALHPVFLFVSLQPLSDVPATAWAIAAIFFARRSRNDSQWALLAGFAVGIDVLIRPACLLIALPVVLILGADWRRLGQLAVGGAIPLIFLLGYDRAAYGHVLASGYSQYGLLSEFAWKNFGPRVRHYAYWLSTTLTVLVLAGWAVAAADRRIDRRWRAVMMVWFSAFLLFYCFYGPFDSWIHVRFLLPAVPALILGFLLAGRDLVAIFPARARVFAIGVATATIFVVAVLQVRQTKRMAVFPIVADEEAYPAACRMASDRLPPNSLILAMAASGALKVYAQFPVARWNWLVSESPTEFLDAARKRNFVRASLLFPSEVADFDRMIPGRWRTIAETHGVVLRVME